MARTTLDKGAIGAHAITLSPDTVDTVEFEDDLQFVEVVSDGTAEIYFTVDGADPEIGDQFAYYMPAIACSRVVRSFRDGASSVRLISAGTPTYSIARSSG
jgi:hypothetical protein